MAASSPRFRCTACGKAYRWESALSGKKIRCVCGQVVAVPVEPDGGAAAASVIALDTDPPPPKTAPPTARTAQCPSCGKAISPKAVICTYCGFNLAKGKKHSTEFGTVEADHQASADDDDPVILKTRDIYLPIGLLAIGVIGTIAWQCWWLSDMRQGFVAAAAYLGIQLLIAVPVMLFALYLTAKIFQIGFGYLHIAVLKVIGISLGAGVPADAVLDFLWPYIHSGKAMVAATFFIYLVFIGVPMALMFDLDQDEIFETTLVISVVKSIVKLLIFTAVIAALKGQTAGAPTTMPGGFPILPPQQPIPPVDEPQQPETPQSQPSPATQREDEPTPLAAVA